MKDYLVCSVSPGFHSIALRMNDGFTMQFDSDFINEGNYADACSQFRLAVGLFDDSVSFDEGVQRHMAINGYVGSFSYYFA